MIIGLALYLSSPPSPLNTHPAKKQNKAKQNKNKTILLKVTYKQTHKIHIPIRVQGEGGN